MKSLPRADNDWYSDPPEATDALCAAEIFAGMSWDPACGKGTIPDTMHALGLPCVGSDIVSRGMKGNRWCGEADFLGDDQAVRRSIDNIVSNPPFKLAKPFAERALVIARHKVAFLLPLTWLEGQQRSDWLTDTPLARVHVFPWRVSMPPGELLHAGAVEATGGKKAFAWFVWEQGWQGPPQLRWLRKPEVAA